MAQTTAVKRKAKSPYQKYGKAPYRYSPTLQNLIAAIKGGRDAEANRLRREHDRLLEREFGIRRAA